MGLFSSIKKSIEGSIENKNQAKDELYNKISDSELIKLIVNEFLNLDRSSFAHIQQHPDDWRKRSILIGSDLFQVKWADVHSEGYTDQYGKYRTKTVEDIIMEKSYSFSSADYKPLSPYTSSNGISFDVDKVKKTFAEVLKDKLQEELPNYRILDYVDKAKVYGTLEEKAFSVYKETLYEITYWVPEFEYKSAF